MLVKKTIEQVIPEEEKKKMDEERQRLVAQVVKLPNGATFTRLKPVGGG